MLRFPCRQWHKRRSELWKVIENEIEVAISDTDGEPEPAIYSKGDFIRISQGQRHRLIGLDEWAIVAEIWQHSDLSNPSEEEDIIRITDDFGREGTTSRE